MNRTEMASCLNTLYLAYPRMFERLDDPVRKENYLQLYGRHLNEFTFQDLQKAIDSYIASDSGKYQPSITELKRLAERERKKRLYKENAGERRIETPEEVMYNIYLEEMEKPINQRNEWLIRQCLPAAKIMTDAEEYIKHFGKPREEYERL